jgi:hypothetical protein
VVSLVIFICQAFVERIAKGRKKKPGYRPAASAALW